MERPVEGAAGCTVTIVSIQVNLGCGDMDL